MFNFKKSAIAICALSSSVVFAGTMGPVCTPDHVTVPCEHAAWDFGIQALYLQPSFSDDANNFNGYYISPLGTSRTLVANEGRWGWGFKLEGSYHYSTGNDVNLNWYHLNDNTQTQVFPVNFVALGGLPASNTETYTQSPKWDAVNLEMGQTINYGHWLNVRVHGGAQYARLKVDTSYIGENAVGTSYSFGQSSTYNGFGARTGIDASYDLGKGLNIYSKAAAALLFGKNEINQQFSSSFGAFVPATGSRTAVVPEIEGKLGLNYNYPLANGLLTIDGGYMWVNYFDALSTINLDDSNFAVNGPYFGLKWVGAFV
ncbi:Lpg1974 family pore-forming outer membrane protein [Legionella impletisoli]|uniref:Membrane protein n=1 Tax=Legionella impletisoli TaxID=343510 RepID=A0A917JVQ2_9GAMM|nr:Lpg1974 family pore-forming outer membrane protein [Legionella impletisoli]GGI87295.1 membrane protein [Legionella impletisoli]